VAELEADLRAWIAAWNEDPKPFVWTKTADEILDNLARYLHLTHNSAHTRRTFRNLGLAGWCDDPGP
jgi:hypothetical protein